ncbi:unnamed protein product, partial [Mesorhabditis belari]|uniref:Uncharacterized protein n=1 Tax=Mesorhabditis belari TaxID=2138241 RepID=A0AAF3FKA2_9BILA
MAPLHHARSYVKTPAGILHILCILTNLGTLLACGLRWTEEGDVYIQIIFAEYAWQTFVMGCLFISFMIIMVLFMSKIANPSSMFARITNKMAIALIGFCIVIAAGVFIIELWYITSGRNSYTKMYKRIVVVMIFALILLVLLGVLGCFLALGVQSTVSPRPRTPIQSQPPQPPAYKTTNPFDEEVRSPRTD